jgi:hypothetical protein
MFVLFQTCTPALAQQHVIANKNVTRTESQWRLADAAHISQVRAEKNNGYNEIAWQARNEHDVQKYVIEYSTDGLHYQSAGELSTRADGQYAFQHYLQETRPMLYRVKMMLTNYRPAYTESFILDGVPLSPVQLYPTIVTGNTININAAWPTERMTIVSTDGSEVFAKDLNGQRDYIPVVIPSLQTGMYIVTFHGRGWKYSEKMVISR